MNSLRPSVLFVLAEFPGHATELFARIGAYLVQHDVRVVYVCASPHYERFRNIDLKQIGTTYYVSDALEHAADDALPADFDRWRLYATFMRQRELAGKHLNGWNRYATLWRSVAEVFDREPSLCAACSEYPTNSLIACAFAHAETRGIEFLGYQAARVPGYFSVARDELGIDLISNPAPPVPGPTWTQPPDYTRLAVNTLAKQPWSKLLEPVLEGLPDMRFRFGEHSIEMGVPVIFQARNVWLRMRRKLRHAYADRWRKLFEYPSPDPAYRNILFPLQYRPEASTLVHARYYNDDYETLRNIAFSLPMDARLLVKEHPAAIGVRDSHFYRRLKELPGVQLAAPDWPLREHLDAISAVVCLTSTLGFEALQAGLPVLMLGRAFYEDYPGVLRVQSWDQLFHALRELPKLTTRHPRPEILQRYANVCFEGRFNYMSRDSLEPDNIVQLAQPLLQAVHGKAAERESRK